MKREEKVKEGEERERCELMVEKLKRGISLGKREGKSTPSPTWKFGLLQSDGTLIPESNFSPNSDTLSARKLGANLWEMEPQLNHRASNINKNGPILTNHTLQDLDEAASPSKQVKFLKPYYFLDCFLLEMLLLFLGLVCPISFLDEKNTTLI